MSLRKKILAATVIAGAATALISTGASAYDGKWYFGVGGGWVNMPDGFAHGQFSIDDGWIADGRVGVESDNSNFRFELDISHRVTTPNSTGRINLTSFMVDAIYDFPTSFPVHPYVGAGVGLGHVDYYIAGPGYAYSGKKNTAALQGIAGLEWKANSNLAFDVEYRYMVLNNPVITGIGALAGHKETFGNHAVLAGLRWTFGAAPPPAPPPPPPPPPAPAPEQPVFKIFFPWNVWTLTPEASKTVDEIAAQYKDKKIERINIQGNTDTSGSSDYNMGLGSKRASSVKAELIAQGIPESAISTESLGETNPAVQTGDNVREPLNRRAEVTIMLE